MDGRLRVGLVGCGNVGLRLHLPAWAAAREVAEVVAVADPSADGRTAACRAAGLSTDAAYADLELLLGRADVDAVDLCVPPHLRAELVVAALAAGKHVLCEKPLAAVPAHADRAVTAAAAAGRILGVVHNYLWLPEIETAMRVLAAGKLGEPRIAIVNFLGVVDVPGADGYRSHWRHDPALSGGGVLMDMLHAVYLAEALLAAPFERVSAYARGAEGSQVEHVALCRFETAVGAALVNVAWGNGPGGIEVCGADGRLSVGYRNGGTPPWARFDRVLVESRGKTRIELAGTEADGEGLPDSLRRTFVDVIADFVAAVRGGRRPRTPGGDGLRVLEATVGAYAAAARESVVELPLDRSDPAFTDGVLGVGPFSADVATASP
jgi:predicted dehydrogenase